MCGWRAHFLVLGDDDGAGDGDARRTDGRPNFFFFKKKKKTDWKTQRLDVGADRQKDAGNLPTYLYYL